MSDVTEPISRADVAHVARLANLALTDDELDTMTGELAAILAHAGDLSALDLGDVAPTTNPLALTNVWRDDVPGPTLDRDEVLAAAPAAEEDRFRVPAILGEAP
ncbi:MAG: Asp-tRNA(Asn)/Glu-tRNA(Gln) amidotransferase subunit GatC [Actinobacteria bacterium]|nr:Asp-tRNA(Asn)/Glu-tRNA(Gln) amidotransferase subunit GatC [Actinomycetota bacterium]